MTRTIARSFAPELGYHLEFPTPLLWTEPRSDPLSLAEMLETAQATFEVWHQNPTSTLGEFLPLPMISLESGSVEQEITQEKNTVMHQDFQMPQPI